MESFEKTTCLFVVKIWTDIEDDTHPKKWRGRVTHIPSGAQYPIVELEHLSRIIATYLQAMGVDVHGKQLLHSEDA